MSRESDITRYIPLLTNPDAQRGRSCPDAGQLAAYAEARLEADQRSALEDHLADCTFCLGQVGFLVREADPELPAVPRSLLDAVQGTESRWLDWAPKPAWKALAAAATVILVAGIVLQLKTASDPAHPAPSTFARAAQPTSGALPDRTVRNGTGPSTSFQVLEPEEGARLVGSEMALRWQEAPQALQYTVLLVSLEGDLIWEGRTAKARMSVPTAELARAERYFVWVEAQLRGGGTLKSAPVGFRLAPD